MTAVDIEYMRTDEQAADVSSMPNGAAPPSEVPEVGPKDGGGLRICSAAIPLFPIVFS